jgi:hypothetical protein
MKLWRQAPSGLDNGKTSNETCHKSHTYHHESNPARLPSRRQNSSATAVYSLGQKNTLKLFLKCFRSHRLFHKHQNHLRRACRHNATSDYGLLHCQSQIVLGVADEAGEEKDILMLRPRADRLDYHVTDHYCQFRFLPAFDGIDSRLISEIGVNRQQSLTIWERSDAKWLRNISPGITRNLLWKSQPFEAE